MAPEDELASGEPAAAEAGPACDPAADEAGVALPWAWRATAWEAVEEAYCCGVVTADGLVGVALQAAEECIADEDAHAAWAS